MSALAAEALADRSRPRSRRTPTWEQIATTAPEMVATMRRYLIQLGALLKPRSVEAAEIVLRQFAGRVTQADRSCGCVAAIRRHHVEDYLVWLRARSGREWGCTVSATTVGHRVGLLAKFFERAIEWGYIDAPEKGLLRTGDSPPIARRLPGLAGTVYIRPARAARRRPAVRPQDGSPLRRRRR